MQLLRKKIQYIYCAITLLVVISFISPFSLQAAVKKKFVVVIDAGHGGHDYGAIENGVNEKDITLSVAQKLGNMITKKLKDTEVIFTRNSDTYLTLQKRADIANAAKADLFISIHCNSVDRNNKNRANVVGATTYVLGHHKDSVNLAVARRENSVVELDKDDATRYAEFDPTSDESNIIFEMTQKKNFQNSVRFAADVQKQMAEAGRVSRGVQQAGFWVLWSTAMPSALIELDFICNPEQASFLNSKEGQDKLVNAIFNAVKKYETYYRVNLGMAAAEPEPKATVSSTDTSEKQAVAAVVEEKEETQPETPLIAASVSVNLPSAPLNTEERQHRADTSTKKTDTRSHRRRSSSAREKGSSQVEETLIAIVTEENFQTEELDDYLPVNTKKIQEKSTTKSQAKKNDRSVKKEISKPGRRDKDKKSTRKSVKSNVALGYRILLFVSDERVKNKDAFKGLAPISEIKENQKFKYTYGNSPERKEMDILLAEVSELFPEARVIKCYY